jgi:hypothetical protein
MAQFPRSCRKEKDMPCSNNVCKNQAFRLKSVEHNAVPLVGNSYSAQNLGSSKGQDLIHNHFQGRLKCKEFRYQIRCPDDGGGAISITRRALSNHQEAGFLYPN